MLAALQRKNPDIQISPLSSAAFAPYGRIVKDYDVSELIAYVQNNIPIPSEGVKYDPSIANL